MAKKPAALRPIMTRMPESLRARLARAAKRNERSMNAEINYRLESSFTDEHAFGSEEMKNVAIEMFVAFSAAGSGAAYSRKVQGDWLADPDCYRAAMFGVVEALILRNGELTHDPEAALLEGKTIASAIATRIMNARRSR